MTDENERRILSGAALWDAMGDFHVVQWNPATREVETGFTVRREFCHTGATTAQGGFVTAWLDATMAQAVIYATERRSSVTSLEIKVTFLERVGPGTGRSIGRITRLGRRVAFMEADLFNADGRLAAKATSTGLVIPYEIT